LDHASPGMPGVNLSERCSVPGEGDWEILDGADDCRNRSD
jgi:hypothetical protein